MKKVLALVLTLVFVLSMTACAGATPAATTKAPAAAENPAAEPAKAVDLTFWTFQELHKQFWDDAVIAWNEQNPDRPINLTCDVYSYDEMHSKLQIALQAGSGAPDLVDIEISKYANFLKGDNIPLVPINAIVEPEKANLIMGRFDNYAKDGKYYGIDYHVGAMVTYYNTDILNAAGVNVDSIKTWADYVEAGKAVKAKTGKYMLALETTDQWSYYPEIAQKGSDLFTESGDVIMDNQINIDVLQWEHDLIYKEGIATKAPGGFYHAEEFWAAMNKGDFASISMPLWYLGRFTDYMPDLKGKIAVRPLPTWTEGGANSAGMGGTGTSVTVQSKNPELAVELLGFAKLSKEGAIKTWTVLGFDPIRKDIYNDPAMRAPNKYTDYFGDNLYDVMLATADSIKKVVATDSRFPDAVTLIKSNILFKVLEENSQSPADALKEAADEIRSK